MAAGRRFGKYLLHDRIAVGGMGELYLATEVGAARGTPPCVLKILLPEYSGDAEYVSMFHDEARIGMKLAHPNVVAVTDLGRVGDSNYLVLEYVHGENLRTLQNRIEDVREKFPVETAIRIGIEVLHGLDHAHKAKDGRGKPLNLVHRDLSPDNVMMSFDGDVKVLDFGIAKSEGRATQTQFGILKGKVQYMSPEQALGQEVDARADLYALGLVLLEIITGERRFATESDPVQMIRDARVWTAKGPSERDPSLPIELDAILLKSLQHEPGRRWQTATEFAAALTRLLRGGGLPPAPEHLPALLRRLFPDRAEPFLQLEPTAGASAEMAREAALRVAPTNPGMEPRFGDNMPDEGEMLGAFLSPRERTNGGGDATVPARAIVKQVAAVARPIARSALDGASPRAPARPMPPPPSIRTASSERTVEVDLPSPAVQDESTVVGGRPLEDPPPAKREPSASFRAAVSRSARPAEPSEDATSPGVRRDEVEDSSERTMVAGSQLPSPSAKTPSRPLAPARAGKAPRLPPPRPPPEPEEEELEDRLGDSTRVGPSPGRGGRSTREPMATRLGEPTHAGPGPGERTDTGTSNPSADTRGRTRIGAVVLGGATLVVVLAAGGVLFREKLPPGIRAPLERIAARAGVVFPVATPEAAPTPADVRATPQATQMTTPATPDAEATPEKIEGTATPPPGDDVKRAVRGGMFPGETTEEVETTRVEIDAAAPSPQTSPR